MDLPYPPPPPKVPILLLFWVNLEDHLVEKWGVWTLPIPLRGYATEANIYHYSCTITSYFSFAHKLNNKNIDITLR